MRTHTPLIVGAALLAACGPLAAQATARRAPDSATVVAGERYAAGRLQRLVLGEDYRGLWTTPVRVPVLDLARFAGGLTPLRTGGNVQTMALRFQGADGREYNFRSVDKELTPALPSYAQETVLDWLRQDQTSAQHPAAPVVATALLEAVGVLHPGPRLVVLPDDPRLGQFRADYAGLLGTIEVHADEGEGDRRLFAGAVEVDGSEDVLEEVEDSPRDRIDARAFLKARLMDVFLGDWDRHEGQWRWARYDSAGIRRWVAVPEDRDYAFVRHDGLLLDLAREAVTPRVIRFGDEYSDLLAMMANSEEFTRRLLAGVARPTWDSVVAELQAGLTYEAIDRAVAAMPPEYRAGGGDRLARTLRARRDRLPEMARDFYRLIAHTPSVHATDQADRAEVERDADGSVTVRLFPAEGPLARRGPYLERRFLPGETYEVRIFLHGGDDAALVTGGARGGIPVRIVGGGGDDVLEDRGRARTAFYDDRGENRFVRGPRTSVDTRPYEPPEREQSLLPDSRPDWGESLSIFTPAVDWVPFAGLAVGGGPVWTRAGFRHHPYVHRYGLRGWWAPGEGRFAGEFRGDFRREASPRHLTVLARASNLDAVRFGGFGNDAPEVQGGGEVVWLDRFALEPRWHVPVSPRAGWALGPTLRYTEPDDPAVDGPLLRLRPRGTEGGGEVGGAAEAWLDTRDDRVFPRRGVRAAAEAAAYPAAWDVDEAFARTRASASTYLSPGAAGPVLALRAGGEAALGGYPFWDAAFLGGSRTLRGYDHSRFAGDALVHGSAELRVPLLPAEIVVHGRLGASLLADAGRVFLDGESPGGWHTAVGGGVWFATPVGAVTLTYAHGDAGHLYLKLGMPF
ncbi:MAG TPA: BamA/TamA family outer membrane protein [Longimicrobiaceae bacterium]|nr:BamA/TamA family outer membrane protein [Longimicrobiaceae bacterium]